MTFQWTLISGVMYVELAMVVIILLPWISPKHWHAFFNSHLMQKLLRWRYTKPGLRIGAGILCLLLADAIREMYICLQSEEVVGTPPVMSPADKSALMNMRMYRAERNLYIAGFALFFGLLLKRLIGLLCLEAELMARVDGEPVMNSKIHANGDLKHPKDGLDKLTEKID